MEKIKISKNKTKQTISTNKNKWTKKKNKTRKQRHHFQTANWVSYCIFCIFHIAFWRQCFGSFLSLIILQFLEKLRGTILFLVISHKNTVLIKKVFLFQSFFRKKNIYFQKCKIQNWRLHIQNSFLQLQLISAVSWD